MHASGTSNPALLVFTWDAPHSCGVTDRYKKAVDAARAAVADAAPGTVAEVRGGSLAGSALPGRVVGRAERTENGVVWTADTTPRPAWDEEAAAAWRRGLAAAPKTTSRSASAQGAGRDVPDGT